MIFGFRFLKIYIFLINNLLEQFLSGSRFKELSGQPMSTIETVLEVHFIVCFCKQTNKLQQIATNNC